MVGRVLETTPPELAGDIIVNGLHLTGGGAQLRELPRLLEQTVGVRCILADQPAACVAVGAGMALQYASSFSKVYDLSNFAYRLSDNVTN
jgi:rod shape-determining protein MreB